jgi:hypothetical protein
VEAVRMDPPIEFVIRASQPDTVQSWRLMVHLTATQRLLRSPPALGRRAPASEC